MVRYHERMEGAVWYGVIVIDPQRGTREVVSADTNREAVLRYLKDERARCVRATASGFPSDVEDAGDTGFVVRSLSGNVIAEYQVVPLTPWIESQDRSRFWER